MKIGSLYVTENKLHIAYFFIIINGRSLYIVPLVFEWYIFTKTDLLTTLGKLALNLFLYNYIYFFLHMCLN